MVAVGCLAERYGKDLAEQLPEADAVLGLRQLRDDVGAPAGRCWTAFPVPSHTPGDRRKLLPLSPVARQRAGRDARRRPARPRRVVPTVLRRRLEGGPVAPLKLASGCDRRCAFCAIPSFRGAFVSRRPSDVLAEARWLADAGVRELVLVSENSTSYGKDLGDLRLLETLLPELAALDGIDRVRLSYLQPAEMRPSLVEVLTGTPGVVPYFDMSFQHASGPLLRRMRRFGDTERFLDLLATIRVGQPAGRGAQQRHRRVPGRDRGATSPSSSGSSSRPGSTRSACSATPTRTAPRPSGCPGTSRRRSSTSAWPGSPRSPRS